ncbi:MAG: L-Proline/Glycine betaine transporter ProP, partial [uncultured Solirubrobacterales bacterium]
DSFPILQRAVERPSVGRRRERRGRHGRRRRDGRRPARPQAHGRGGRDRQCGRVVRLRRLRLPRRDHRPGLLPGGPEQPGLRDLRRLCRRAGHAADRRDLLRSAGRPGRAPDHAGHHDDPDGRSELRDRPTPFVRDVRHRRFDPALRLPPRSGLLDRRRVRRRDDLRGRAFAGQATRLPHELAGVRHARWLRARIRNRDRAHPCPSTRELPQLRMAHPLPHRRSTRSHRPLPAPQAQRDAGVRAEPVLRRGRGSGPRRRRSGQRDVRRPPAGAARLHRPRHRLQRRRLHAPHVHADLSEREPPLRPHARPGPCPRGDGDHDGPDRSRRLPVRSHRAAQDHPRRGTRLPHRVHPRLFDHPEPHDHGDLRRPAPARPRPGLLHRHDAGHAAGALSDAHPLHRAVDRLQHRGGGIRRHDTDHRRRAHRGDGEPAHARLLPHVRCSMRRDRGAVHGRDRAPFPQGLPADRGERRGGARGGVRFL